MGACSRTVLFPWWADVADRNDRGFLAVDDSPVAAAEALAQLRCDKCVTRPAAVAAETRENANCAVAAQKEVQRLPLALAVSRRHAPGRIFFCPWPRFFAKIGQIGQIGRTSQSCRFLALRRRFCLLLTTVKVEHQVFAGARLPRSGVSICFPKFPPPASLISPRRDLRQTNFKGPLPHTRNGQRQLPLQGKLRRRYPQKEGGNPALDPNLNPGT